tara:strand:- start:8442 stop:10256 length:1815 start_codon:yes stop_codon:yes gene_type:complete
MLSKVRKRDGKVESFDETKIEKSIRAAMHRCGEREGSRVVTREVVRKLKKRYRNSALSSDAIQDLVEETLMRYNLKEVARSFITHRNRHKEAAKVSTKFRKESGLSFNAIHLLEEKILQKDANGRVLESPGNMFRRVAKKVASVEDKKLRSKYEEEFYDLMTSLDFLPSVACLRNAGTSRRRLISRSVLKVPSNMRSVVSALNRSERVSQSGGVVEYSLSHLDQRGEAVSFMEVLDQGVGENVSNTVLNGVLRVDHPDIFSFTGSKVEVGLRNSKVSVSVKDDFMNKVVRNKSYWLRDKEGNKVKKQKARDVYDYVCGHAWSNGNPELVFKEDVQVSVGGAINLKQMKKHNSVDWVKLARTVKLGVRFLDNVLSASAYHSKSSKEENLNQRNIGLGVMGWANLLISLHIPYDSEEAASLAKEVMGFINSNAEKVSEDLAKEKGAFQGFNESLLSQERRNASLMSISSDVDISVIAACSQGVEALESVASLQHSIQGVDVFNVNKSFKDMARFKRFYSQGMVKKIAKNGSVQKVRSVPKSVRALFKTSRDLSVEEQVKVQAMFQKYSNNVGSSKIHLSKDASVSDVRRAFMLAWKKGCPRVSVSR